LIVTETVFNIPGVAAFWWKPSAGPIIPIVQNLVMLIAVVVVVANFTVDMLYAVVDPRIRYTDLGGHLDAINTIPNCGAPVLIPPMVGAS